MDIQFIKKHTLILYIMFVPKNRSVWLFVMLSEMVSAASVTRLH